MLFISCNDIISITTNDMTMDETLCLEQDLIILIGSCLVSRDYINLADLIGYLNEYSGDEIASLISFLKEWLTSQDMQWFSELLIIIKEYDAVFAVLKAIALSELEGLQALANTIVSLVDKELIDWFLEFWGES